MEQTADILVRYFDGLGRGTKLGRVDYFKQAVYDLLRSDAPPPSMLRHFWNASRAASLSYDVNSFAMHRDTRPANYHLASKLDFLTTIIEDKSVTLSPDDLSKLLEVHLRLQTVPSTKFMSAWVQKTTARMDGMSAKWLRVAVEQLAKLGVYPGDEWVDKWLSVAEPISGEWDQKEGCAVLYRLAQLDFISSNGRKVPDGQVTACQKAVDMFFPYFKKYAQFAFEKFVDSRIYFAAIWFGQDFVRDYRIEREDGKASALERKFYDLLLKAGVEVHDRPVIIDGICHRVDLGLNVKGQIIGAEVDGIMHFNRMADGKGIEFNTSTRFQSWLISELMPELKVMRVPYFMIEGCEDGYPWQKAINKCAARDTGVYACHGQNIIRPVSDANGYVFKGIDL